MIQQGRMMKKENVASEMLLLKNSYILCKSLQEAKDLLQRSNLNLPPAAIKELEKLPLLSELGKLVDNIAANIKLVHKKMQSGHSTQKEIDALKRQCQRLYDLADILNNQLENRFVVYFDHYHYFKMEIALLALDVNTAHTLADRINPGMLEEKAKKRLAEFPTLAKKNGIRNLRKAATGGYFKR